MSYSIQSVKFKKEFQSSTTTTNLDRRQSRKWHKSPHNRFKMLPARKVINIHQQIRSHHHHRYQKSIIVNIFIVISLIIVSLVACRAISGELEAVAADHNQQPQAQQQQQLMSNISTTNKPTPQHHLVNGTSGRHLNRKPRLHRIQTLPFNGRLSTPIQIEASDASSVFPGNAKPARLQDEEPTNSFGSRNRSGSSTTRRPELSPKTSGPKHHQVDAVSAPLRLVAAANPTQAPPLLGSVNLSQSGGLDMDSTSGGEVEGSGTTAHRKQQPAGGQQLTTSSTNQFVTSSELPTSTGPLAAASSNAISPQPLASTNKQESSSSSSSDSILSLIDEYDSKITTNRTKAQLSCDSGEMILRLNFSEPFKGIVYPDHDRLSPCRFFGDGHNNYELRLPLRGCGTRQAAPRFFINNVVVRFHKTLELEEDEVKTLICRYPPPLAVPLPVGPEGQLIQQRTPANRNRFSSDLGSQFEFVDTAKKFAGSAGGRFSEPLGGDQSASGTIDTSSENLVVSPSTGGNFQQRTGNQKSSVGTFSSVDYVTPSTSGATGSNQLRKSGQLNNEPNVITADLFDQNRLNGLLSNQRDNGKDLISDSQVHSGGHSSSSSSFFERLSSLQLLFLISSLMFLLLVALGLAMSYFCFRRHQAAQRRRRRRAVGLVASGTGNERASAILKQQKQRHYAPGTILPSPLHYSHLAASRPPTAVVDSANRLMPSTGSHHHHHLIANNRLSSSSSPESDLSGRQLISRDDVQQQQQQQQHQQQQQQQHYAMFNRGYIPEPALDPNSQYLVPTERIYRQQAIYDNATNQIVTGANKYQSRFAGASTGAYAQPPAKGPIVGRRESLVNQPGRAYQSRHQQQGYQQWSNPKLLRVAYSENPIHQVDAEPVDPRLYLQQQQQQQHQVLHASQEPLVTLSPEQYRQPVGPGNHHPSVKHSPPFNKQANRQYHHQDHQMGRAAGHAHLDPNHSRNNPPGLWRAKSLSSVQHNHQRHRQSADYRFPVGGTLMRTTGRGNYRNNLSRSRGQYQSSKAGQLLNGSQNQYERSEGVEMASTQKQSGRLILKSIEDSYITNVTEISQQEYVKRDSTRPLSMAEWRQMQPPLPRRQPEEDTTSTSSSSDSDEDRDTEGYRNRAASNLRSLTELDVDFAKSSLVLTNDNISQNQLADKATRLNRASTAKLNSTSERLEKTLSRSSSMPLVNKNLTNSIKNLKDKLDERETLSSPESPDLILSPDYDHGQSHRLELIEPEGSLKSSRNSVSYV